MKTNRLEVGYGVAEAGDAFTAGWKAAYQAVQGIKINPLSGALVFASVSYDLGELLRGINTAVGKVPVLGATTAGEICNGPKQKSVVVVALASPDLEIRFGVGEGVSQNWCQAVNQAINTSELAPYFSHPSPIWSEMIFQGKSPFGLLFSPGNTNCADSRSFEILEELKRLSQGRLPIMGGSAADDWQMQTNYVLCGNRAYPDSLLVAVFETRLRFGLALDHGFSPSLQRATVTCSHDHEVMELDYQVAAEVYSKLQGFSREHLEGKHLTLTTMKPAGILDPYKQYSINVASYFTENGGVRFSQPVTEGTVLTIMDSEEGAMVKAGQEALRKAILRGDITEPAVILVFSCAIRSVILKDRIGEEISAIQDILPGIPVLGFYSFGEQGLADDCVNRHNNGVISLLLLSRELSHGAQVALENKRLHNQLEKAEAIKAAYAALENEVSHRKKAEKALSKSKNKFQSYIEWAPLAIFVANKEGHLIETNRAATELLGYDAAAYKSKTFLDLHPDEDHEIILKDFATLVREGRIEIERRFKRSDGQVIWGLFRAVMIGGQFPLGFCQDITERKRAEQELLRIKFAVDNISDAVGMSTKDGQHFYQNQAFTRLFGYTTEEIRELHPAVVYGNKNTAQEVFKTIMEGNSWRNEIEMVTKFGRHFPVSLHADAIKDHNGNIVGLIGIHTDITERKQAEETLRASETKYRTVVENIPQEIFLKDKNSVYLSCNENYARDMGIPSGEVAGRTDYDFFPKVLADKYRADDRRIMESGKTETIEEKYPQKGEEVWVQTIKMPIRGEDGSVAGVLGIFWDITERKRAEQALRESEERFRRLSAAAFEAIVIHKGGFLFSANDQYYEMFGYEPEELLGKDALPLTVAPEAIEPMREEIATGGLGPYESMGLKKDGTKFPIEIRVREMEYEGRTARVAAIMNITERKLAETALADSAARLRQTLEETVSALAATVEMRDPYTAGHQRRVTQLACALARELGLQPDRIEGIRVMGFVHDIGKIAVPAGILSKPGKISPAESDIIKTHPQVGHDILQDIEFPWPVAQAVLQHHERLDGSGYPQGLHEADILQEAKILAVADVVEAMVSHRPYRPALGIEKALEEITKSKGILYDPEVVDAGVKLFTEQKFRFEA